MDDFELIKIANSLICKYPNFSKDAEKLTEYLSANYEGKFTEGFLVGILYAKLHIVKSS